MGSQEKGKERKGSQIKKKGNGGKYKEKRMKRTEEKVWMIKGNHKKRPGGIEGGHRSAGHSKSINRRSFNS